MEAAFIRARPLNILAGSHITCCNSEMHTIRVSTCLLLVHGPGVIVTHWMRCVARRVGTYYCGSRKSLPSRNYGSIPVPEAGPTCDKARFPWHRRCEIRRNVWLPHEVCC